MVKNLKLNDVLEKINYQLTDAECLSQILTGQSIEDEIDIDMAMLIAVCSIIEQAGFDFKLCSIIMSKFKDSLLDANKDINRSDVTLVIANNRYITLTNKPDYILDMQTTKKVDIQNVEPPIVTLLISINNLYSMLLNL